MNKIFLLFYIVISTFFLARYFIVGQAVYGDGLNYWSYTHSIYFDHDIDISNQLQHLFSPENNNISPLPQRELTLKRPEYRYPPLASLLWLPSFMAADVFVVITSPIFHLTRNGFSDIYQITVGLFNTSLITLGTFNIYKILIKYFEKKIVFLSIITFFFASNLFYYGSLDVINSHPVSFFLSSIYLIFFTAYIKSKQLKHMFILGILSGLLASTRTQDILFLFLTVFLYFVKDINCLKKFQKAINTNLIVISGFILGFIPQLIFWLVIYGKLGSPYVADTESFNLLHPRIIELITFYRTGILYFSPIVIVAFVGMFIFARHHKVLGILSLVFFLAQYYLIASWSAWHQGASYGNRMLISSYPFIIFGLSELINRIHYKINNVRTILLFGIFVLNNLFMIFYFQLFIQDSSYISGQKSQNQAIERLKNNIRFFK